MVKIEYEPSASGKARQYQVNDPIRYWTPEPGSINKKTSRPAMVAQTPLVQQFVSAAIDAGFNYPAELVRESEINQDTLHYFVTGRTVLSPENMYNLVSRFSHRFQDSLWDLYGCELRRGKGSFRTVRGTESAHIAAENAYKTRKIRSL